MLTELSSLAEAKLNRPNMNPEVAPAASLGHESSEIPFRGRLASITHIV